MHCQFDGYLSGVGSKIKECLNGINIVNGYSDSTEEPFLNRMGRIPIYLAKNSEINYEMQANDGGGDFIDYSYHLRFKDGRIWLSIDSFNKQIYDGFLDDFNPDMDDPEDD